MLAQKGLGLLQQDRAILLGAELMIGIGYDHKPVRLARASILPCSISSGTWKSAACRRGELRFSLSGSVPSCFLMDSASSQWYPSSISRPKSLTPATSTAQR